MNRLKRLFLRNGLSKLFALFLAIMLYFAVSSTVTKERIIKDVPVKVTLSGELAGANGRYFTTVTIKGSQTAISQVSPDDLTANVVVTPNHLDSGNTYSVKLTPAMFSSLSGITVIPRERLVLNLQKVISRKVPVEVRYSGKLSKEYNITETLVIPSEVTVTGAENVVNSLRSVTTSEIPLSRNILDSFEFNAPLALVDNIKSEPEKVLVQTSVSRSVGQKEIKSVPVLLFSGAAQSDFAVSFAKSDTTVDIVVSGPLSALAAVSSESLKPYVDASRVNSPSTLLLPVECSSGVDGVVIKSTTPGEVAVKVSRIKK